MNMPKTALPQSSAPACPPARLAPPALPAPSAAPAAPAETALALTPALIEEFLCGLSGRGRAGDTLEHYRRSLRRLHADLGADQQIRRGTLDKWQAGMRAQGLAPRTVNLHIAAANSLLEYCGRRELKASRPVLPDDTAQPELSRAEYLRLLSAARQLGRQRTYLLVKVFGSVGLSVQELPLLTAEAARQGLLWAGGQPVRLPSCLQTELLSYAAQTGVYSGPVFVSASGTPLGRRLVTAAVHDLAGPARVPQEKCNPRCLKKLCQATQERVRSDLARLFEQAYDQVIEAEQLTVGWEG